MEDENNNPESGDSSTPPKESNAKVRDFSKIPSAVIDLPHRVMMALRSIYLISWGEPRHVRTLEAVFWGAVGAAGSIFITIIVLLVLSGSMQSFFDWFGTSDLGGKFLWVIVGCFFFVFLVIPGLIGFLVKGSSSNDTNQLTLAYRGVVMPIAFITCVFATLILPIVTIKMIYWLIG